MVVVIAVENVSVEVVKVVVGDDDDDEMNGPYDEVKLKVSIATLLPSMSNVMMIEAKCK